ncbi:MAG: AsmA-like C-terminal region-containing protein [Balneolaceae bacterium]
MKKFWIVLGGIAACLLLTVGVLNLYFTDDRLREMILPQIENRLGVEAEADHLSITLFRSFPHIGLQVDGLKMADPAGEPVLEMERMNLSVRLIPIFRSEFDFARLDMHSPSLWYRVYADSTSNLDRLLEGQEEPDEDAESVTVRIPSIELRNGSLFYSSDLDSSRIDLAGLDAEIGLQFEDLLHTTTDARLQSLSLYMDHSWLLRDLPLQLRQKSTVDLADERLNLTEGVLSIRGLRLNLEGSLASWSGDETELEMSFESASDDFGELLGLAPPAYSEYLQGLETGGELALSGTVSGIWSDSELPWLTMNVAVREGYLQNPDLPEPIRDITLNFNANNDLVILEGFSAVAAGNRISATGQIEQPLGENALFQVSFDGDTDLSTLHQFYPIGEIGLENVAGMLAVNGTADGNLRNPEEAAFDARFSLQQGYLKYLEAPLPIEEVTAEVEATQDLVQIHSSSLRASSNRFSLSGTVSEPLSELPDFNLRTNLDFDLGTLKEFYPIDEDTLMLRGHLIADATLRGRADQLQRALDQSTIELRDGYIAHEWVGQPLENITFLASASSSRLQIQEGRFKTGQNELSLTGTVDNYMDENPVFDLSIQGNGSLEDLSVYYSLEPWINELTGRAVMDLRAQGPAGDPLQVALNGSLELTDVNASGDSLGLPVTGLNGLFSITPQALTIDKVSLNYGSSDFLIEGRLERYLGLLQEHESEETLPLLTGSYRAQMLNLDEMIDWDEENGDEVEYPIYLPKMRSEVTAEIGTIMVMGIPVTEVRGSGRTDPNQMMIDQAEATLFGGRATGLMAWEVPRPDRTRLRFEGELQDVPAAELFGTFPILGKENRFAQHVTGAFSGSIDYATDLDIHLDPDLETTISEGSFGLTRARMRGHPVQSGLASWLNSPGINNLALDEWTAGFSIDDGVLTFRDFHLTSESIGIELEGTQNLISDEIHFTASLLLPGSFRSGLSSVISSQAVTHLTRDDGIIVVPVEFSGKMGSPRISPRQNMIEEILRDAARGAGENLLRRLFDGNR